MIEGHTDDVGDDAFNLDLSERRAANVRAALIELGVAAERLESRGMGETRPLTPITEGMRRRQQNRARSTNRRVEFRITEPMLVENHPAVTTGGAEPAPPPPAPAPTP
jgi:outer membrane protein OmpA-like peptidoglycan-associated protein